MVIRTFKVLDILRDNNSHLSVEELQAKTGIPKSSVYRILRTLVATGYVARARDGGYHYSTSMLDACRERPSQCS
jgi:DNA-binding IclR family transcriptional regulator